MSKSFDDLVSRAASLKKCRVSVAVAQDEPVLQAVMEVKRRGIADATLVGDAKKIGEIAGKIGMDLADYEVIDIPDVEEAAAAAVKLVHDKKADILLKGMLESNMFLRSMLNKEYGLRSGRMLSHVCVFEIEGIDRLLFFTDVAFNTYPTLEDKVHIIENAVDVAKGCGIAHPLVAPLCAVEKVNPKMQPTLDADELTKRNAAGEMPGCTVYGPLSMDLAIDPEAAVHKGIDNPVAGHADILLFPNIDAGNITYKLLVRTANVKNGNIIVGTSAPVVLTSRSDDAQTKINSITLAAVIAGAITD